MSKELTIRMTMNTESLEKALQKTKEELKTTASDSDKLNKISENLRKIEASAKTPKAKVAALKNELVKLAEVGAENTELYNLAAEATRKYKDMLDRVKAATESTAEAQRRLNKEMRQKTAAAQAAETSKSIEKLNRAIGHTNSKLTQMQGALGAFGAIGTQFSGAIASMQSSLMALQTAQTAVAGSSAGAAAGTSALLGPMGLLAGATIAGTAAWLNYNKQLEDTTKKTAQFTGYSGDELMSLRAGIKSVASTWGKEYDTVLSAVDGLMSQYGMNGEAALRIIRDGFVSGADEGGKMLDMISQYSGAFNDIGISADQLVAIIANTRSGIFDQNGMDLIQMAGKNIRDLSTAASDSLGQIGIDADDMKRKLNSGAMSTFDALRMISGRLKEFPAQSQEVGAVLQDVFGKKGAASGYQLVTALADVNDNLDEMKQQTGDVGEATQQLQEAHRELETAMALMFGTSEGGFSTMWTTIQTKVIKAMAELINRVIELYNKYQVVRFGVHLVAFAFKAAWEVIKLPIKLWLNGINAIAEAIKGLKNLDFKRVGDAIAQGYEGFVDGYANTFKSLKKALDDESLKIIKNQIKSSIEIPAEIVPDKTGGGTGAGTGGTGGTGTGTGGTGKTKTQAAEKALRARLEEQLKINQTKIRSGELDDTAIAATMRQNKLLREQLEMLDTRVNLSQMKAAGVTLEAVGPKDLDFGKGKTPGIGEAGYKAPEVKINTAGYDAYLERMRLLRQEVTDITDSLQGSTARMIESFQNMGKVLESSMAEPAEKVGTALATVGSSLEGLGASGAAAKAGAVLAAIGQLVLGYATATAQATELGPFGWLAFSLSGLGTLATMISTVKGYAQGGIITGGPAHGDQILARVNAGEMVLTRRQQGNLWNLLDGGNGRDGEGGGEVRFELCGDVLYGVLRNYIKKMGKL